MAKDIWKPGQLNGGTPEDGEEKNPARTAVAVAYDPESVRRRFWRQARDILRIRL